MPSQIIRFQSPPASRLKSVWSVNVEFGYWPEQAASSSGNATVNAKAKW
jgi:hypothetical protein